MATGKEGMNFLSFCQNHLFGLPIFAFFAKMSSFKTIFGFFATVYFDLVNFAQILQLLLNKLQFPVFNLPLITINLFMKMDHNIKCDQKYHQQIHEQRIRHNNQTGKIPAA